MDVVTIGEDFRQTSQLRRRVSPEDLQRFTRLSTLRSVWSVAVTVGLAVCLCSAGVWGWQHANWVLVVLAAILMPAVHHQIAILLHDAIHYRLFATRWLNETVGWLCGAAIGVSAYSYRIIHRIHHNHLYQDIDPDMPLQGGYPRGRRYLVRKLLKDVAGLTFIKNYRYFFGAPAMNHQTGGAGGRTGDPLADTTPRLRQMALRDRWLVLGFQVALIMFFASIGWLSVYLVLWVLPLLTIYQAILRLRAVAEHGAVSDPSKLLTAARTNLHLPWVARFYLFPHHVNFHLEHHLYPAVPHYYLPALHRELERRSLLDGAEVRAFSETLERVFANRVETAQA